MFGREGSVFVYEKFEQVFNKVDQSHFQLIPIKKGISDCPQKYQILNILKCIDCLNEELSVFTPTPEDKRKLPAFYGNKYELSKLVIDPKKIPEGSHLFRLMGCDSIVIVSEEIAKNIRKMKLIGFNLKIIDNI
ncbi:imm11 family protein [Fluviispira sanaruensis]|uniref:Immunity MXAN-0049 protein domain-containing protein n=1 Tax=Fluviispira sanaruensis TaxID=2493639 RepID=A0A4P2VNI2_FLUSA|nr:DUF1629 domain-containing protein [Fluviispira sanaruensis]BBH53570.1 hypothetical protein JCM31447_20140 [Fluviispira sanaruensis]